MLSDHYEDWVLVYVVLKPLLMTRGILQVSTSWKDRLCPAVQPCCPLATSDLLVADTRNAFGFCKLPSFRYEQGRPVRLLESHARSDLPEFAPLSHAEP